MRDAAVIPVVRIGSFAADIIAGGSEAEVIAVFERSFYLLCDKGIVAVCLEALGNGPLNILVAPRRDGTPPWQGELGLGAKATVSAARIDVAGGIALKIAGGPVWSPPPWPTEQTDRFDRGVDAVRARAATHFAEARGDHGLAPLLLAASSAAARSPTAAAGQAQITALRDALPVALAQRRWPDAALSAATLLVGLGPGLTPSGDDLLGGLLLALAARGEVRLVAQLFDGVVDELGDLTVPVSAMHLTAAAHGMGHETLHTLIGALVTNTQDGLDEAIDAVAALGATSGWDTMAGVVLALDA